jgi:D-alanyl-D-alanine carboxypeptidase (penicillin-binding protein 5/6)
MCKKVISIVIIINILFCNFVIIFADDVDEELDDNVIEVVNQATDEPVLNSRIAVAYDRKSGNVIWGKNENKRTAMASTTKIMTAIVLIENADLNKMVTVSAKAAGTGGSRLGLKRNDKISLRDLLYGLMLKSGNDSAVAIAEEVGGSIEGFAEMMNSKAAELGLENTHFVTPHGLDNPEHYTTAFELAKLADYALKNEMFAKVVGTKNYTVTINGYPKNISNTNELLGYLNGVYGVKTGFTNNAGRCLVTSVNRNNFDIITVVLQADTKKFRTTDSIKLIEYVYENYELLNIKKIVDEEFAKWCEINLGRITINKCKDNNLKLYVSNLKNDVIPVKKTDKDCVNIDVNNLFSLEAPVEVGKTIGNLKVTLNGKVIDVIDVKNKEYISKNSIADYLRMFMLQLCR